MLEQVIALFRHRIGLHVVLVLAGLFVVVLAALQTVVIGSVTLRLIDDPVIRRILVVGGMLVAVGSMVPILRAPVQGVAGRRGEESEAARVLRSYYDALNQCSPAGYERAWSLLSEAKRTKFAKDWHWHTSSDFARGFSSVVSHTHVFLTKETESGSSESYLVIFLVDEEFPVSPAREILLGSPSKRSMALSVLQPEVLGRIAVDTSKAVSGAFDITGRDLADVQRAIRDLLEKWTIEVLLSPKLVETIGLELGLTPRAREKKIKNQVDREYDPAKVTMINVERRSLVKDPGTSQWLVGHVNRIAEAELRG